MSDLEQGFRSFIDRHPELRASFSLLNTRALARHFIKEQGISGNIEAVVAMIRRTGIDPLISYTDKRIFSDIKISTKDEITILDYEKSKSIVQKIRDIVPIVDYDRNETLKIVTGAHSVKIIIDSSNRSKVKQELRAGNLLREYKKISEISLLFPKTALEVKGIISYITSELLIAGINIQEIITCTPELIIYVDEDKSLKAFETLKRIKE